MNIFERDEPPTFPPLLRGEAMAAGMDPFAKAVSGAITGIDAGLVTYALEPHRIRAAMVLAPEAPLEDAMAMVFAAALGFGDALGALAPPEVGVHMDWPGGLRVNGAKCGRIRAAAADTPPDQEPDWLIVGFDVPVFPTGDTVEPGQEPDNTTLSEEGCGEISANRLVESWARHTLVWINRWLDEGLPALHGDWRARVFGLGEEITLIAEGKTLAGTFVGLDEKGGALVRTATQTTLVPLSSMLET